MPGTQEIDIKRTVVMNKIMIGRNELTRVCASSSYVISGDKLSIYTHKIYTLTLKYMREREREL